MVWGCMTTAGIGELWFIEGNMDSNTYFDIMKQKMMPSIQKHNHPRHTAKMTTALMLKLKVMVWPNMSPDLNPIEHIEPATTCVVLVNSLPRKIKTVLNNNGAPTKY